MTPEERRLMIIDANMTIQVADNEGWTSQDRSRSLAKLALKAAVEIDHLRAENERLREALEKIRDTAASWEGRKDAPYWNLGDIASAALEGGE